MRVFIKGINASDPSKLYHLEPGNDLWMNFSKSSALINSNVESINSCLVVSRSFDSVSILFSNHIFSSLDLRCSHSYPMFFKYIDSNFM